jgi:hypothetical protein
VDRRGSGHCGLAASGDHADGVRQRGADIALELELGEIVTSRAARGLGLPAGVDRSNLRLNRRAIATPAAAQTLDEVETAVEIDDGAAAARCCRPSTFCVTTWRSVPAASHAAKA